jgi:formate hydrogenlyase subunit 6/NADH:ubiquinone oxidoreductase subunit I
VHVPEKRRFLLAALRRIATPVVAECEADSELWAQFGFTEACTGCQMCAFFCPTGALSKVEEDGKAGLAFRLSHCTNCRLCQDICYKGAVTLSSAIDLRQVFDDAVDLLGLPECETAREAASPRAKLRRLPESLYSKTQ